MTLTDARGALELVCTKCTRFAVFPAPDRRWAYMDAARKGWHEHDGTVICPGCAK